MELDSGLPSPGRFSRRRLELTCAARSAPTCFSAAGMKRSRSVSVPVRWSLCCASANTALAVASAPARSPIAATDAGMARQRRRKFMGTSCRKDNLRSRHGQVQGRNACCDAAFKRCSCNALQATPPSAVQDAAIN